MSQIDIFEEIIVDNFAGGGGASTGIELATGRPVTIAINHDPDAILMHQTNHPYTTHYQESVWDIDPEKVCMGRPVGLAWFSPDCKHFSKAKGGKPVEKKIRGLAWIVLRWAGTVRPRVIMLENVEEFQTWGPVRKGKPVKSKAGQTFQKFIKQITALGYAVEFRELVAADYGAPTTRKRFFMIARCDGKPIVWPEPTHAPADSDEVKAGKKLPWRAAAEIIDWSLPCPSIFETKEQIKEQYGLSAIRPLKPNTMRRIIRGVDKFTIKSGKPFIVQCNHSGDGHINSPETPLGTVLAKHTEGIASPVIAPITLSNTGGSVGSDVGCPVHTVRTAGGQLLTAPSLMAIGQTGGGDRCRTIADPIHTQVSKAEECLLSPSLIQYHTEQSDHVRASGLTAPINTIDAANRYGLSSACLVEYFGNGNPLNVGTPLHTVTAKDREALTTANLCKYYGGVVGADMSDPLPTVTAIDHNALEVAHVCKFKGQDIGQGPETPLHTITASPGEFATVKMMVAQYQEGADLRHWPKIRELLNEYCGYKLQENEVILLCIAGIWYFIADIGLRMLTPRELYAANGAPADYIIDHDYTGAAYGKAKQVARCGNMVPPPFSEALVRVNLPEWCDKKLHTMAEWQKLVAV